MCRRVSGWLLTLVMAGGGALVLSVTVDAQPVPGSPWPMFGHDARHIGRTTVTPAAPELRGTFKWIYDPDDTHPNNPNEVDRINGGVAIGPDGKLFFGTQGCRFICVNRATGQRIWSYPPPNQGPLDTATVCTPALGVGSAPGIDGDGPGDGDSLPSQPYRVYFTTDDGRLWCFSESGALHWVRTAGDSIGGSPVIGDNGKIYVGAISQDRGIVRAYDSAGTLQWSYTIPKHQNGIHNAGLLAGPAIGADGTIYVGDTFGRLFALQSNGQPKWEPPFYQNEHATSHPIYCEPVIGDDGTIFFSTFHLHIGGNGLHAVRDNGVGTAPSNKWNDAEHLPYGYVIQAYGPNGVEPIGNIEGGPFLDWSQPRSKTWFGTYHGLPSRLVRVEECPSGDQWWAEAVVATSDLLERNVDAVGACARWWDGQGVMQQAIVIAFEEPILYSLKPEAVYPLSNAYSWRLGPFGGPPPVFPEYIERPHVTIDSDGTIYVGSYHGTTGKLYAIWGP